MSDGTSLRDQSRAHSLDAVRGLAILLMVLSGVVPFRVLPAWMYHAQLPPPTHVFDSTLPGLTWVDLVFPMFLFAMGAAIPLALSRRLQQGVSPLKLHAGILERGFMLAFFAIFLQHVRPYTLNASPDALTWLTALAGFAAMFAIYASLPRDWSPIYKWGIRVAGWISALVLLYLVTFPDGSGFRLTRSDIIIIVLANMAVFGAWVWLATRENLLLRLGVMGVLLACILSAGTEGWVKSLWDTSPAPWVFRFYYLKYLFIIIPGLIAGEQLLRWQQILGTQGGGTESGWPVGRYWAISVLGATLVLICLVGLQIREVTATVLLCFAVSGLLLYVVREAAAPSDKLLKEILQWGVFWLALGLAFEPFEGGIKKDWSTFSYYFVSSGLTVMMLIIFMIVLDLFRKHRWVPLLVENGQNPMIAYVGMMNLLYPLLGLTGLLEFIAGYTTSPWVGFLRAVAYTILLAWIVALFTRRKVFWKT
jgi:predicted acyltransferase